jgi:hypothetical protein
MGRKIWGVWHYGWRRDFFNLALISGKRSKDRIPLSSHLCLEFPLAFCFDSCLVSFGYGRSGLAWLGWAWLGCVAICVICVFGSCICGVSRSSLDTFSSPFPISVFYLADRPKEFVQIGTCVEGWKRWLRNARRDKKYRVAYWQACFFLWLCFFLSLALRADGRLFEGWMGIPDGEFLLRDGISREMCVILGSWVILVMAHK